MKSICLIAARKQSKGVKKKNIRLFSGKPLISHAIQSSLKSKNAIDRNYDNRRYIVKW